MSRIEREKHTVEQMIQMYCRSKHGSTKATLCPDCQELRDYAFARLEHCKFGEKKTTCEKCPVHCYKPQMRERIREIMRYSGPRMLFNHPIMALRHLLNK